MVAWRKLLDSMDNQTRQLNEYHARANRTETALAVIAQSLRHMEKNLMQTIQDVLAQVTAENTVIASAVTLINGLKAQIDALKAQPQGASQADLAAISDAISSATGPLAAAVAANTPVAAAAPAANTVTPVAPAPAAPTA